MPRVCTVCTHPKRDEIDLALLEGQALRNIAERYGLSATALHRHKDHLPGRLAEAHEAHEAVSAGTLLDRLRTLNDETRAILKETRKVKNHDLSLKALARLEKQLELEGKLLGELKEGATMTVNVYSTPEWLSLRAVIITALIPYPEAARAVTRALASGEGTP